MENHVRSLFSSTKIYFVQVGTFQTGRRFAIIEIDWKFEADVTFGYNFY